jgi:hypothetical protein
MFRTVQKMVFERNEILIFRKERKLIMAGDLYIENLPEKAMYFLMAVAGESGFHKQVHHANRTWADNSNRLTEQLIQPTQNRASLPPHAYIELNRAKVESF